MSKPGNENIARKRGCCMNCGERPVLHRQATAASFKGVWWCIPCDHVAFGSASWTKLTDEQKRTLPLLGVDTLPCEVCGKEAVLECHHLAPRAQFGDEADRWPTVMVCHECHRRWEDRMGTHPWRAAL